MYDDIPIEVRRYNWGYFGDPWPSGICLLQDDNGMDAQPYPQWDWDMQRDFPTGKSCTWCHEQFQDGDSGTSMPMLKSDGSTEITFQHKECGLRQVLGSYKHLIGNCPGDGSCHSEPADGMTLREDALAVWEWSRTHGRAG